MAEYTIATGGFYDSSTAKTSNRDIAMDSSGNLHCVYAKTTGKYPDNKNNIFHAKSTDGGQNWTETQISSENYYCLHSSLAIDSNDNLHVVWEGVWTEDSTAYYQIYYSKFSSGSWSTQAAITSGSYNSGNPSIAIDSSDNIHVVFNGGYSGVSYQQIRYLKYSGGSWSAVSNITSDSYLRYDPSIAIDSNDYIHVVWEGKSSNYKYSNQIFYSKYTNAWSGWSAPLALTTDGDYEHVNPCIAIDSNDRLHVVWEEKNDTYINVYQIFYRRFYGFWETAVNLTSDNTYHQYNANVSTDTKNNYVYVVWEGQSAASTTYRQIRFKKYAGSWGSISNLTTGDFHHSNPSLIFATHPYLNDLSTNIPDTGYFAIYSSRDTGYPIKAIVSSDLVWNTTPVSTFSHHYRRRLLLK